MIITTKQSLHILQELKYNAHIYFFWDLIPWQKDPMYVWNKYVCVIEGNGQRKYIQWQAERPRKNCMTYARSYVWSILYMKEAGVWEVVPSMFCYSLYDYILFHLHSVLANYFAQIEMALVHILALHFFTYE